MEKFLTVWLVGTAWIATAVQVSAFELDLPLTCEPNKTCWIQQYADHDTSAGAKDYLCGSVVYDGHDGTDFRVLDTSSVAPVVASAAGIVMGTRDGVEDHLMRSDADKAAVANRECGNGVAIDHGDGWETQYCHMKMGSVIVKQGDKVLAGQRLGDVGYSGAAQFPHVHLTVRKDKKPIDPFSGPLKNDCSADDTSIWSAAARAKLTYAQRSVLRIGFADRKIAITDVETGNVSTDAPEATWPIILGYAWAINLKQDDTVALKLEIPGLEPTETSVKLDRNKAVYFLFAGKKRPEAGWPAGQYKLSYTVTSGSKSEISEERVFEIGN